MNRVKWQLLSLGLLVVAIPKHSTKCTITKAAYYDCQSMRDLEEGNLDMKHVTIYNDTSNLTLSAAIFQATPNMEDFEIRYSLTELGADVFSPLRNATKIRLMFNSITRIVKNAFANLPVVHLDLSYNKIIYIEKGAFVNLTRLRRLELRKNNLRRVTHGIFNDLSLQILSISNNEISILESDAFRGLENLKRLHLDGNLISEFRSDALIDANNQLEILWLQKNFLREIDRDTVKNLSALRVLNLQDNKIARILLYAFENLLKLETLVLSHNELTEVQAEIFPDRKLAQLYLDNNRLSFLTTKTLERLSNLKGCRFGGNPWQCACLDMVLRWFGDRRVKLDCDRDYFEGTRPICIVTETHPHDCVYGVVDPSDYQRYVEVDRKSAASPMCAL